jgi:DNA-binding transcriptional ArsR family regulator
LVDDLSWWSKFNHMVEQSPSSLDSVFHALADPTRRAMLGEFRSGERKIGELAAPFAMSLAAASKHVKVLENAGLVRRRICGRTHLCRIELALLVAASEWLRCYERVWAQRLKTLDMLLQDEDKVVDRSLEESE